MRQRFTHPYEHAILVFVMFAAGFIVGHVC